MYIYELEITGGSIIPYLFQVYTLSPCLVLCATLFSLAILLYIKIAYKKYYQDSNYTVGNFSLLFQFEKSYPDIYHEMFPGDEL